MVADTIEGGRDGDGEDVISPRGAFGSSAKPHEDDAEERRKDPAWSPELDPWFVIGSPHS